ncbi:MAG: hypothetical protein LBU32_11625 [Clostridiales bacterium]|jgi:hypothetical protein|nr:hypothetical protein [Clostridiales bacterium]
MPDWRKGFIFGRRSSGSFDVRTLDGEKLSSGISHMKLKPLAGRTAIPAERKKIGGGAFLPRLTAFGARVSCAKSEEQNF